MPVQRGLTAIRDAFDSAFSELIRLEPFELEQSATWLTHRIVERTEQLEFGSVHTLHWHSRSFLLFCATMLEVFDDDLTREQLTDDIPPLAVAQRRMAAHPQLAWRLLLEVRKRFGLDTPTST